MSTFVRSVALSAILALPGCSSGSSKDPGGADAAVVDGGDGGGHGGSTNHGDGGAGKETGGAGSGSGGKTSAPGAGGGAPIDAPEECVKYCECMDTNCAEEMFPNGCLADCAAQTTWDIPCRHNMCNNAPFMPENGHCIHAMGRFECLDKS